MIQHGKGVMEGSFQMELYPLAKDVSQSGPTYDAVIKAVVETVETVVLGGGETVTDKGSETYQNSEMPYDPNCIPNPYNPYGFSNQQPAFQYTNVHQLKRDAANSGQYQVVDNLSKKPHAQQPSQVVYLPQINSFPYGAPLYQNLPAVYPPGTRSYPSYIPGKAETGKSPC